MTMPEGECRFGPMYSATCENHYARAALCTHAAQAIQEGREGLRNAAEGLLKVLDPRAALADFKRMSDEEMRCCLEASSAAAQALQERAERFRIEVSEAWNAVEDMKRERDALQQRVEKAKDLLHDSEGLLKRQQS